MAKITDTEKVAGLKRRVRLGDETYWVPSSPTLKYQFFMQDLFERSQSGDGRPTDLRQMVDETVQFLRRYNKTVDEDALLESCAADDFVQFFAQVMSPEGAGAEGESEEAPPPPAARRGTGGARKTTRRATKSVSST